MCRISNFEYRHTPASSLPGTGMSMSMARPPPTTPNLRRLRLVLRRPACISILHYITSGTPSRALGAHADSIAHGTHSPICLWLMFAPTQGSSRPLPARHTCQPASLLVRPPRLVCLCSPPLQHHHYLPASSSSPTTPIDHNTHRVL